MNWVVVIGQTVAAMLGAVGGVEIIKAIARRRVTHIEAADRLNESTLKWAEDLKQDSADARKEAREARRESSDARAEATQVRREMQAIKDEAGALASYLRRLVASIHDPAMTIERLRVMASDPGPNGALTVRDRP